LIGVAIVPIDGPGGRSCGRALSLASEGPLLYPDDESIERTIDFRKEEARRSGDALTIREANAERDRLAELRVFGCADDLTGRRTLLLAASLLGDCAAEPGVRVDASRRSVGCES